MFCIIHSLYITLFDWYKFDPLISAVLVVKEKFFPSFNVPKSVNSNSVLTINFHDFGETIRIDRMICEADLVATSSRINRII